MIEHIVVGAKNDLLLVRRPCIAAAVVYLIEVARR